MRLGGTDARGYALLDDRGGAAVEFRILGGLEVDSPAGPARIAGGRRRALLIRLLVAHGQSVSADRLIDDIWDRAPPAAAASTLQSHVSLLRRALGPGRLITRSDGYALAVDDVTVDAWQFEAELAGAREALAAGDPVDAAELLTSGLGRWRGPALADVAGASWAVGESVRLEELHLDAM